MDPVGIRPYRPTDRQAVEAVMRTALEEVGAYFPDIEDEDGDTRVHEDYYRQPHGVLLVAVVDGEIIGTAGMRAPADRIQNRLDITSERVGELKRMHVLPDWQGRGVGTQLLEAISAKAEAVGYEELVFTTSSLQQSAHEFYDAHGFDRVDTESVELGGAPPFELWYYRGPVSEPIDSANTS